MKQLLLISMIALTATACRKHSNTAYVHAVVTGQDLRKCACCGGYVLRFDNGDSSYRFFNYPVGTSFDTTTFPQSLYISYKLTDSCGPFHFLKLTAVSR